MDCRVGKYKKKKDHSTLLSIKFSDDKWTFWTYCKREVWIRFFPHATGGNEEFFSISLWSSSWKFIFIEGICRNGENFFGGGHREYITAIWTAGCFIGSDGESGESVFRLFSSACFYDTQKDLPTEKCTGGSRDIQLGI